MALPFKPAKEYGKEVYELGKGTYGKVMMTDAFYAIKTVVSLYGFFEQSTLEEIVSLLKVTSPYVIPLIDVIITPNEQKLVLPLADGNLTSFMGVVTLNVKSLVRQLCLGLEDIHNADLLHLDLKPDNLLLHNIKEGYLNAQLWIADLGISRIHTCAFPPLRETFFTLWYRPPEIMLGGPISEKCDIWALGVVIAELLISQAQKKKSFLLRAYDEQEELLKIFSLLGTPPSDSELSYYSGWRDDFPKYKNVFRNKMKKKGLDEASIDFLEFILRLDPGDRPTITEILQHPWLELPEQDIPEELTCRQRLERYSHYPHYAWKEVENRYLAVDTLINLTYSTKTSDESLALSIYLLDRLMTLQVNKNIKNTNLYIVACHYIAAKFYDDITYRDYTSTLTRLKVSADDLREASNDILLQTSFDLAPVTSYFFLMHRLQMEDLLYLTLLARQVWRSSLYTMAHFGDPSLVADAIVSIVTKETEKNPLALGLAEEIRSLPDDLTYYHDRNTDKGKPVSEIKDRLFKY